MILRPLVSVVMPLYNKEKYISQAIESVLAQTILDFELIIINDGSKDSGPDIVNNYHDPRILLINQENQGVSAARNRGISEAKSDIIAFLDSDDVWYPNFLETILRLYNAYPHAGMYGTAYSLYFDDKHRRDNIWKPERGECILPSYFGESVTSGFPIIMTSSFAAPKVILDKVGGYQKEFRAGQDHDLYGRLALFYDVAYSPEICSRYNAGAENNVDIVHYAVDVPLEAYLLTLSPNILNSCMDRENLSLYLDFWRLKIGGINIYAGYRREGRKQLFRVKEPVFFGRKMLFCLLSYVPFSLSFLPSGLVRNVANKMKLAA